MFSYLLLFFVASDVTVTWIGKINQTMYSVFHYRMQYVGVVSNNITVLTIALKNVDFLFVMLAVAAQSGFRRNVIYPCNKLEEVCIKSNNYSAIALSLSRVSYVRFY